MLLMLVGNKCDLEGKREVTYEEGQKYSEENNMMFYETSVKEYFNILKMFENLAKTLKSKADQSLIDPHLYSDLQIVKLQNNSKVNRSGKLSRKKMCLI